MDKQKKIFKIFETRNQVLYGTIKGRSSAHIMWSIPHKKYAVVRYRSLELEPILRGLASGKVTPIGVFKSKKRAKKEAKQSLM